MIDANKKNFSQLLYLRLIAIVGQVATILFVHHFLKITLPLFSMMMVVLSLVVISLIGLISYKKNQIISDQRLFFELLFDVLAFSVQIYFSGGISNPFISLFLLQVIISAILLKGRYAWLIAAITIICYLFLSKNYNMLHALHRHDQSMFDLHLYGMLISYVIATILLLIFITKITKNLKEKDAQVLAQEQLIRMGLLASNAAHELGTPLTTMLVMVSDLKKELPQNKDIEIIESQINRCKKIISNIISVLGNSRLEEASKTNAKAAFDDLIKTWVENKNPKNLIYNFNGDENLEIIFDDILKQSLHDVFDNALEASKDWVKINVDINKNNLIITILDQGEGFSGEVLKNLGKSNLSTKNSSGIGLFLAINSIKRIGGKLEAVNLANGAQVKITIKL